MMCQRGAQSLWGCPLSIGALDPCTIAELVSLLILVFVQHLTSSVLGVLVTKKIIQTTANYTDHELLKQISLMQVRKCLW